MKKIIKISILITAAFILLMSSAHATAKQQMSPAEEKQFVKDALIYALENKNPNMDYSKYVSKDFRNRIDGNTFTYDQWVNHQQHIKASVRSMTPVFDTLVAENNTVAAIFYVNIVKNDGTELEVKDMGFFQLDSHKIVYVEELTRLVKGPEQDKNIGSMK